MTNYEYPQNTQNLFYLLFVIYHIKDKIYILNINLDTLIYLFTECTICMHSEKQSQSSIRKFCTRVSCPIQFFTPTFSSLQAEKSFERSRSSQTMESVGKRRESQYTSIASVEFAKFTNFPTNCYLPNVNVGNTRTKRQEEVFQRTSACKVKILSVKQILEKKTTILFCKLYLFRFISRNNVNKNRKMERKIEKN